MCFNGNSRVINWDHMIHRHSGIPRMIVKSFLMTACSLCVHAINSIITSMFMDFCWLGMLPGGKEGHSERMWKGMAFSGQGHSLLAQGADIELCVCSTATSVQKNFLQTKILSGPILSLLHCNVYSNTGAFYLQLHGCRRLALRLNEVGIYLVWYT